MDKMDKKDWAIFLLVAMLFCGLILTSGPEATDPQWSGVSHSGG